MYNRDGYLNYFRLYDPITLTEFQLVSQDLSQSYILANIHANLNAYSNSIQFNPNGFSNLNSFSYQDNTLLDIQTLLQTGNSLSCFQTNQTDLSLCYLPYLVPSANIDCTTSTYNQGNIYNIWFLYQSSSQQASLQTEKDSFVHQRP